MFLFVLSVVVIVGLNVYMYTKPSQQKCPECQKCPSGFLPTISSEGLLRPSPFVILTTDYIPDQNTYSRFYGSGWTINTDGKHVCPQQNIFSRIHSKVDPTTPDIPFRDEFICLTPEDKKYNCRIAEDI